MASAKARKIQAVRRVARGQHGVVTRRQAVAAGFSVSAIARAVERGEWRRLHSGIFVVDPAADPVMSRLMAAILRAPGRTWASHRSACAVWGIGNITPLTPEVSTTAWLRHGCATVHRVVVMPDEDACRRMGLPVTSPERTLVDFGGVATTSDLEAAIINALRTGLTTRERLNERAVALAAPGRRGSRAVTRILEEWGDGARSESVLESRLLGIIRRHQLPEPARQWVVRDGGRFVARVDFAYPRRMVAIEADGYRWHTDSSRWRTDLSRRNALTKAGWLVLHFTWDDVNRRPGEVAATIARALFGPNVPGNGTKGPGSRLARAT
jgi:very-short-patch-repair endonuclease